MSENLLMVLVGSMCVALSGWLAWLSVMIVQIIDRLSRVEAKIGG